MGRVVAAIALLALTGCTPEVRYISDGCLHFKAIRPTAEEVDMLSAETARQIYDHDETGAALCGWAP